MLSLDILPFFSVGQGGKLPYFTLIFVVIKHP